MIYLVLVLTAVILDQLVKYWAIQNLMISPYFVIPGVFQLTYVENRGTAFSFLQGQIWLFTITTILILLVIAYVFWKRLILSKLGRVSLAMITGGAIGNFLDRSLRGYVVDMFYFELIDFPVFNIADVFIVIGGILFAYYFMIQHDKMQLMQGRGGDA